MKNNLFYYATSELSQDAFICWLSSFALEDVNKDIHLKDCAKEMICLFVPELKKENIVFEAVEKQVKNIDVLLTVSYQADTYKIIIEDKTFTSEHDNQLLRYVHQVKEWYPQAKVRGVYYKTGFQSDLNTVEEAKYTVISRKDILNLMEPYTKCTSNQIFMDYYEYWNDFQRRVEEYKIKPVSEWKWEQINGFYESLKNESRLAESDMWLGYGYVANPTGGFEGLWTGFDDYLIKVNDVEFELYLQVEAAYGTELYTQICLKMCVKDKNTDAEIIRSCRDKLVYNEKWEYILTEYGFKKPKRLVLGKHMTVGVYDTVFTDYRSLEEALYNAVHVYKLIIEKWK